MNKVFFHYEKKNIFRIKNSKKIRLFIEKIFEHQKIDLERIDIIFCSDQYLLNLNQEFLKHDTYTDIITFSFNLNSCVIRGELYVSVERVRVNALHYNITTNNEMLRVIVHGILHLCGFNDKSKKEKANMKNQENYYLSNYKI